MTSAVSSRGAATAMPLHHDPDVSPSSPPRGTASDALQRTGSASSSTTVHPLSNGNEVKSSLSASSSPTLQSAASSSMHNKTSSTLASSMRTADSHTSFPNTDGEGNKKVNGRTPPAHGVHTAFDDERGADSYDTDQGYVSRARNGADRWDERRYRDDDEDVYSIHDEEAPIQYPPISEEDREARKVELKLGQWAAEEKQRRKAKRSSRAVSTLVPPATSNRLSKRLSALGSLAKMQEHSSAAAAQSNESGTTSTSNGIYGKQGAVLSTDALMENGRTSRNTRWLQRDASLQNIHEAGHSDEGSSFDASQTSTPLSTEKGKGKQREASDPFQDPVPVRSAKPTARHPIVTPGRAPTMRHRALEKAHTHYQDSSTPSGAQQRAPAIVATDADEEREAQLTLEQFQRLEDDPFQSASERRAAAAAKSDPSSTPKRREMTKSNSTYTIGSTIDESPGRPELPKRKSTSSRFNEIGLDDGQDASGWPVDDGGASSPGDVTPRPKHMTLSNDNMRHRRGDDGPAPRAPWYSEWLCGCGTPDDPELEQSGRTFPE